MCLPRIVRNAITLFSICVILTADRAEADPYTALYDVIMDRQWPDGDAVDQDSPTPLLWTDSRYLLREPAHSRFMKALSEFERLDAAQLNAYSPLNRALLQRQLWVVFDWSASRRVLRSEPAVQELQLRIARLLKRLALSESEIQALPDSLSDLQPKDSVGADGLAPTLPVRLDDPSGEWVCLRRVRDGLIAPAHSRSSEWRSAFLVYVRVPGGRPETIGYLNKLSEFRETVVQGPRHLELNPKTPQFPVGTQFALIERPLLISDRGELVMSPLCFRVQLRSYVNVSQPFILGFSEKPTQLVAEYVLRPRQLMNGKRGLERLKAGQTHYATFFTNDPFEKADRPNENRTFKALKSCMVCHSNPGILSVNSRAFTQLSPELPVKFREGSAETVGLQTRAEKEKHFSWGLLEGLWRQERLGNR